MNKTVNINLASTFFQIDEEAYKVLNQYLKKLEITFSETDGKEEILEEIEARIAELFQASKKHNHYVINQDDVTKMIETLGEPEDFIFEEEPQTRKTQKSNEKKLFRDTDDCYIGGVGSGIGHYFVIDAVWIRLLFILLTFLSGGSFALIYGILWVLIQKAESRADKLKMKGEPVNIVNIKRKIKEEFDDVKEKINQVDYDQAKSSLKKKSKNFFTFLENLLALLLNSLVKIVGVILILTALCVIIGLSISFISFAFIGFIDFPLPMFDGFFELSFYPLWIPLLLLFLSISIPFVFIFILGMKIFTPSAKPFGFVIILLVSLWLLSVIILGCIGANELCNNLDLIQCQTIEIWHPINI